MSKYFVLFKRGFFQKKTEDAEFKYYPSILEFSNNFFRSSIPFEYINNAQHVV